MHDYNPGYPGGVFWTLQLPDSGVVADVERGTAVYQGARLANGDYGNGLNALQNALPGRGGGSAPLRGEVSFRLLWSPLEPKGPTKSTSNPVERYRMEWTDSVVRAEWSSRTEDGFGFTSYRLGHYPSGREPGNALGVLGTERNGVFY